MIPLYYDLHLHSCLSPCGDDDMTPANLVGMAAVKGLDEMCIRDRLWSFHDNLWDIRIGFYVI